MPERDTDLEHKISKRRPPEAWEVDGALNEQFGDLRRNLGGGEVCAFVGAGLSVGAGLPSWYDLIAELSARIGYKLVPKEWSTGDALIDAAQAYVNRQGLHSLISHLKDRLDTTGKQPSAAHRALARLPISLVFTANFDDLLERAFRDAGKRVEIVVKDSSIPFMRRGPDTVNIVKLYGDLDQPDTIVLGAATVRFVLPSAAADGQAVGDRAGALRHVVPGLERERSLLQVGLRRTVEPLRANDAVGLRASMFDVIDVQRDELARKHIRLVDLPADNRTASLAGWLDNLSRISSGPDVHLDHESDRSGNQMLIVPTDVATFEAVLREIVRRTGSRSEERLHLFVARRRGINDPADTVRIGLWLNHPDQITGTVDSPIVGDLDFDLRDLDADAFDVPDAKPQGMVAGELTRHEVDPRRNYVQAAEARHKAHRGTLCVQSSGSV